jgi:hypothetical protein
MTIARQPPRIPAPTATQGTLLWAVQAAHRAAINNGSATVVALKRKCLETARNRPGALESIPISPGLREYFMNADQPWDVLWGLIERSGVA